MSGSKQYKLSFSGSVYYHFTRLFITNMRSTTALCIVILLLIFDFTTAQQGRIYDGYPIDISEAPHAAQVTYTRKHHSICVGGILSPYLILTAAHCKF